jgi:DNA-binding helix-hairpin-helix protein with protein kinase domain
MTYRLADARELRLGPQIARGREGTVFRVVGQDKTCVKIYRRRDAWLEARLAAAVAQPPARWPAGRDGHHYVAWPQAVVYDEERRAAGFLMTEVRGVSLLHLYEPESRADSLGDPTWGTCVAIARELAAIFDALHPAIVVGDVSPNNVLVTRTGRVCLIDCDSMQFPDPTVRRIWRARMATPDYAPYTPGQPSGTLAPDHDLFGLAILICELLMAGQHPYDGRPVRVVRGEGRAGNIRIGANRLTDPESLGHRPGLIPATMLPANVRRLMKDAFTADGRSPVQRPTAAMWMRALDGLADKIVACGRSLYHRYPRGLRRCIWCEQVDASIGDYFPPPSTPRAAPPRRAPKRPARTTPPPDYGHRPKPGAPPLPTWPAPHRTWKDW